MPDPQIKIWGKEDTFRVHGPSCCAAFKNDSQYQAMIGRYFAAYVSKAKDVGHGRGRTPQQLQAVIATELLFPEAAKTIDSARLEWKGTAALN